MSSTPAPFRFTHALVREPSPSVVKGLRDGNGDDPDYTGVQQECTAYRQALRNAGLEVIELPALDAYPDAVFVEDPALVFSQGAIELRPGAPSRFGEAAQLRPTLEQHFAQVLRVEHGYADGGDVLRTPDCVFIGLSDRTNQVGAESLLACLATLGLRSNIVRTPPGVLHFKSDCSLLDETRVLSTRRLAASGVFNGLEVVEVAEGEEGAANALRVNDHVLVSREYPQTADKLDDLGFEIVRLSTREIAKIDAGLSCLSLRWYQTT